MPTKQVQRSNQDSSTFIVTYIGKHCCQPEIYLSDDHHHPTNHPFSITFGENINLNIDPMTQPTSTTASDEDCSLEDFVNFDFKNFWAENQDLQVLLFS